MLGKWQLVPLGKADAPKACKAIVVHEVVAE